LKKVASNIFLILLGPEKAKLIILTLADLLINILDVVFLAALVIMVNVYTRPVDTSSHWVFLENLVSRHFYESILLFFLLFAAKNGLGFLIIRWENHFIYQVAWRISSDLLEAYLDSDFRNYSNVDSSVHIRKISQQAIQFGQYVLLNFQQIVSQTALIVVTVAMILFFNASLFLLLVLVVLPPAILVVLLLKKRLERLRFEAKLNGEKTIQHLYEALNAFVESHVFSNKKFFTDRFAGYQKKMNLYLAGQQTIQSFPSRLIEIFAVLGLCALTIVTRRETQSAQVILLVGAFMGAAYKIIPGIVKILNSAGQIRTYSFTVSDLIENNYDRIVADGQSNAMIHSIEFNNVCFNYRDRKIIQDQNFSIFRGELVGISGDSGTGKTTILNLLLGFLQPESGMIKINGADSGRESRLGYLADIAYAKQQPFFINDTIQENIVFGNDPVGEKLNAVIDISGVNKICASHAEGLNYMIEENGKNMSGGERQRIIFARTLYKKSGCIILDEPFSELDEAAEKKMMKWLQQHAREGKMVIMVTHRKSSLDYCDKIIFLT